MLILGIDPGGKHCGMCVAEFDGESLEVVKVWEQTPEGCADDVKAWLQEMGRNDQLVVEEFRLYADKAQSQTGSRMETVEVIGVLRYLWRTIGEPRGVTWTEQGASIKIPTRKILKASGIASVAKAEGAGGHCLDAETHVWRRALRMKGAVPV